MRASVVRYSVASVVACAVLILAVAVGGGSTATTSAHATAPLVVGADTANALPSLALTTIASGFKRPVYLTQPPDDTHRLFVVLQGGRIRIIRDGVKLRRPFFDIAGQVSTGPEQGLLSLAFDPQFATNRFVYVDYTNLAGNVRVVRYRVMKAHPNRVDQSTARVLLRVREPFANHNGGQLQFGPDGKLYVAMGDGGSAGDPFNNAQNTTSRLGKILTIDASTSPVTVSMYAYGLRNPWRFAFDKATGDLWIGDVGQDAWEEVDYLPAGTAAGTDFGWSGYEGTHVYNATRAAAMNVASLTWPVAEYPHPTGEAIIGGYVYRGSAIPGLQGTYLYGDYMTARVWALTSPGGTPSEVPNVTQTVGHISSFGQDSSGELYLITLGGTVDKIVAGP